MHSLFWGGKGFQSAGREGEVGSGRSSEERSGREKRGYTPTRANQTTGERNRVSVRRHHSQLWFKELSWGSPVRCPSEGGCSPPSDCTYDSSCACYKGECAHPVLGNPSIDSCNLCRPAWVSVAVFSDCKSVAAVSRRIHPMAVGKRGGAAAGPPRILHLQQRVAGFRGRARRGGRRFPVFARPPFLPTRAKTLQ